MKSEDWPWQYSFPPFFTVQPNLHTRSLQINAWTTLVLKYHKLNNQYVLDIQEAKCDLFTNSSIDRTLSEEGISLVMSALVSNKNAEPIDKQKARYYIYWHTLEEWAAILSSWASDAGHSGSVCTLYEIINTEDQEFHGMHQDVLIKVLKVLEGRNEAEIIVMDDNNGSAQLLEKYHYTMKTVLVGNTRNYFPSMFCEYYENRFMKRFRDTYFTYLPGRPNDALTIRPWEKLETKVNETNG